MVLNHGQATIFVEKLVQQEIYTSFKMSCRKFRYNLVMLSVVTRLPCCAESFKNLKIQSFVQNVFAIFTLISYLYLNFFVKTASKPHLNLTWPNLHENYYRLPPLPTHSPTHPTTHRKSLKSEFVS